MLARNGNKNMVGEYEKVLPDFKMKYRLRIIDANKPRWSNVLLNIVPLLAFGIVIIKPKTIKAGRIYAINQIRKGFMD
jgi:hypothetical protein